MIRDERLDRVRCEPLETLPGSVVTADELETDPPVIVPERFVVDDAAKASWLVRKVVEARAHAERVRKWCEHELRRAEREESWLLRRFGAELETWARAELERRGSRRRSLDLPGGAVGFRLQPPRLGVEDEQAVLNWCRHHLPVALRVTVEASDAQGVELLRWHGQHANECRLRQQVLRDPLNRHVAQTGEVPEGAAVRPAADQFYVR